MKAGLVCIDLLERLLEFGAGGGDVLQERDGVCELDEERLIAVRCEHFVEEGRAGGAFVVEHVTLAHAGVDEQADGERNVGVVVEVANGLGFAVDLQGEVVAGKPREQRAALVADDGRDDDQPGVDGNGGGFGRGCSLLRISQRSQRGEKRGKVSMESHRHD